MPSQLSKSLTPGIGEHIQSCQVVVGAGLLSAPLARSKRTKLAKTWRRESKGSCETPIYTSSLAPHLVGDLDTYSSLAPFLAVASLSVHFQ